MGLKYRLQKFFYGRYGNDELNRFILAMAVLIMILYGVFRVPALNYISLGLLVYTYVRLFSKNIERRYQENQKYLAVRNRIKGFFSIKFKHVRQMRDYHFYSCPNCRQKVRVPRGRGKIEITCPKCREAFIRRS